MRAKVLTMLRLLYRLFQRSEEKCVLGYKLLKDGLRRIDDFGLSLNAYCRLTHPTLIHKILLSSIVRESRFIALNCI